MKIQIKKITLTALSWLLLAQATFAQTAVNGTVRDSRNAPVPGAVVLVQGTTSGTMTDGNGHFSLTLKSASAKTVLEISCIGYSTWKEELKGRTSFNVILEDAAEMLEDAVVVGYGAMRRSDLTGSVTSVKIDENNASKSASLDQLLQGHAAGVQVVNSSAAPDAAVSIRIRGMATFNSSTEPLYVVDGIILNTDSTMQMEETSVDNSNGLMGINPNDIASIEILKDASATAIYGSQASNGVILITTKSASRERPVINFNAGVDLAVRYRKMPMLSAEEYAAYQDTYEDILKGYPLTASGNGHSQYWRQVFNSKGEYIVSPVDWQDYMLRTAVSQRYYLSISGKPKNLNYMFSLGYRNAEGVIRTTGFENYTMRINLDYDLSPKLKVGSRSNVSFLDSNLTQGASTGTLANSSSMMRSMLGNIPYQLLRKETIDDIFDLNDGGSNYLASPDKWLKDYQNSKVEYRVNPNFYIQYKILPWLNFKSAFGADYRVSEQSKFTSRRINAGNDGSYAIITHMNRLNWNWDNLLMFNKWTKKHSISGTVGMSLSQSGSVMESVLGKQLKEYKAKADAINSSNSNTITFTEKSSSLLSFFARAVYSYRSRYVVTTTIRADGSSKFKGANKWGFFPSFAFAWRMNEESWFNNPIISQTKIRIGWGQVGNQAISSYQTMSNYTNSLLPDHTAGNLAEGNVGILPENLANKALKWETTDQTNIGIDYGMWKGRFTVSADAYYKKTRDLLQNKKISSASGYSTMWMNFGSIENKGVELTVEAVPVKTEKLEWSIGGNISMNRNRILQIGAESEAAEIYVSPGDLQERTYFYGRNLGWGSVAPAPLNIFIEGQPMGLFYGYAFDGYVQEGEAPAANWAGQSQALRPGARKFKDLNGDGKIDDLDRTVIGNPNPDFTYGFNTSLTYRNFTLSMDFNGVFGNEIYNENRQLDTRGCADARRFGAYSGVYFDAWTPSNPVDSKYPRVSYFSDQEERVISSAFVEDGSFLRLSSVSLAYDLAIKKKSSFLRGINFGITGTNLILFTNYSGFDPEVNSHASVQIMGADLGSYPGARSFSFDVKLRF